MPPEAERNPCTEPGGFPRARPMSLSDCPSFHRFQSSYLCSVLRPRFALATRYAFRETVQHLPVASTHGICRGLLREGKRVKFAFIHAEKAYFEVTALWRNLGVSRQGYYAYSKRKPGLRAAREQALRERLKTLHTESRGTYGSPRLHGALRNEGQRIAKRRVERAMRSMGLRGCSRRRFRVTTKANPTHGTVGNLLDRQFSPSEPNQRWVTDITYLWTNEGWCYLAVVLDLFSRAVVGWSIDANLSTSLPLRALEMALLRRRPKPGLLHHSDRGCQYTSTDYLAVLHSHGIAVSMSRRGNCWDNAVAESFFATLKTELIHERTWQTRLEVRAAIFEYIEVFYNRQRLHSTLGYKTPIEIETQYAAAQAA